MARNQETVFCAPEQWTELTNADATTISFQVQSADVYIRFTADATPPTETRGLEYTKSEGELPYLLTEVSTLPGVVRVWARPVGGRRAIVVVSTD